MGLGIVAAGAPSVIVRDRRAHWRSPIRTCRTFPELSDYRPKLPLRVFSAEGTLIGEFGEERRNLTPIASIPQGR